MHAHPVGDNRRFLFEAIDQELPVMIIRVDDRDIFLFRRLLGQTGEQFHL